MAQCRSQRATVMRSAILSLTERGSESATVSAEPGCNTAPARRRLQAGQARASVTAAPESALGSVSAWEAADRGGVPSSASEILSALPTGTAPAP